MTPGTAAAAAPSTRHPHGHPSVRPLSWARASEAASAPARERHTGVLFRSAFLTIADTTCPVDSSSCALETLSDSHRLVFTRAGAAIWRPVGAIAHALVVDPAHVLLLSAGETCRVRHSMKTAHACTTFHFSHELTTAAVTRTGWSSGSAERPFAGPRTLVTPDILIRYHRLRRALLQNAQGHAAPDFAVEVEAMALLECVLAAGADVHAECSGEGGVRASTRRRRRAMVESVKQILATGPGEPHRLGDIAIVLGVSTSHLAHVFRAEVGLALHQYLLQLRMSIALDRLSAGHTDLSRLALDLGFATHSHFAAAFRQCYEMRPRDARTLLGPCRTAEERKEERGKRKEPANH